MVVKFEKEEITGQNHLDESDQDDIDPSDDLIKSFLLRSIEDGGFTTASLQELAHLIGVNNSKLIHSDMDLVRAIQKAVKHRPCFRSENHDFCKNSNCLWQSECKKIIAEWLR